MNKNLFAPLPPMGWNSYDYYDTTVTEADVKANADFMAAHLKDYGWDECNLDGIHPNDLGYFAMANNIQKYLEKIIANSDDFRKG